MEYFRILNLCREPFSNSPDPELSFRSRQYVLCLQRLELSIRFRRGLNVVMGEVGTGKTTLCRQLIRQVADDDKIEAHLIPDPSFSTPQEFLIMISAMFGLDSTLRTEYSNWQLREYIKNYLFRRGVDEQKIVVLIIDEGQKLPDFCLEILRELLNYETNEYKLLQTIIFAQKEFQHTIAAYPNFADRISLCHTLGGMNFSETRQMIHYRLSRTKAGDETPNLFSYLGLWAVYRATGGYPRKIVHLCHRVLLALIIRNQSKAGWSLVWWCASMLYPTRRASTLRSYASALAGVLLLVLVGTTATGYWKIPSFFSSGMMGIATVEKGGNPREVVPALETGLPLQTSDTPGTVTGNANPPAPPDAFPPGASEGTLQFPPHPVEPRSSSVIRRPVTEGLIPVEPVRQVSNPESPEKHDPDVKPAVTQINDTQATVKEEILSQPSASEPSTPRSEQVKDAISSEILDSRAPDSEPHDPGEHASRAEVPPVSASTPSPAEQAEEAADGVSPTVTAASLESSLTEEELPAIMGKVSVRPKEQLAKMIGKIYGVNDQEHLKLVVQANPDIINRNHIVSGTFIRFPAIPAKSNSKKDCWYVQVDEKENLSAAYELSRHSIPGAPSLRLIPFWDKQRGMRFSVILDRCFATYELARDTIKNMPPSFACIPINPASRESDTVFFAR